MNRLADYLFAIAITLWVGALWAIGSIAAPTLFLHAGSTSLAGALAGHMFRIVAWVGLIAGAYGLLYLLVKDGVRNLKSATFWFILFMLLLTLAGHFGINPILKSLNPNSIPYDMLQGVVRERFDTWHGVYSVLYLVQSILGVALVTQTFKR